MAENTIQDRMYNAHLLKHEGSYSFIGFLIWPFGATIEAIRNWDRPWSKNVFWLFCIFFGFTFIIAEEGGADSDRYAREFIQLAHSDIGLKEFWGLFYAEGSEYADIISPLIMYLVSRITVNPSILFIVFGIISGYFYSRNIWYILERVNRKLSGIILLYFLTFILLNPIWNINGFRFSLAAQIFLFGTLPYLLEGKKRNLIWSGVSVLTHFTFIFPVVILGLFVLIKNRINIYLIFFIITSFIREIDLQWLQSTLSFLPDILFSEILQYTNAEYAEFRTNEAQELPWFVTFSSRGIRWVTYLVVLSTFLFGREILKERSDLKTLLSFILLFYGFANIVSLIPSGDRFIIVAHTFVFAYFMILLATLPKIGETIIIKVLTVPLLLLFCLVNLRIGMSYFSIMTIIGNPFTTALYSDPVPLITEIKNLL